MDPNPVRVKRKERKHSGLAHSIGHAVHRQRTLSGWTLRDLAERVPCSISTLSELERGQSNITLDLLDAIVQALGCALSDLLPPTSRRTLPRVSADEIAALYRVADALSSLSTDT